MRIKSIATGLKSLLPDKVYDFTKNSVSPIYQQINYRFLPSIIKKRPVIKLDRRICGRFIVSTANGLFLIEDDMMFELLEGNFYGVTLWRDRILVYKTYGHKGRILSFPANSPLVKEKADHVLNELPHGCHQIDVVNDKLYITDTYNNRIVEFNLQTRDKTEYYPCGRLTNGRQSSNYAHINSIFFNGNQIYLYCHNETAKTGKQSTVLVTDLTLNKKEIIQTGSGNGHNVIFFYGHLYHCDSVGKCLKRDNDIAFQTTLLTRGLSISKDFIVLGGSEFAEKKNRSSSKGRVFFMTHDFNLLCTCMTPGPVQEIRRIDSKDFSLSNLHAVE